jgi:predicted Zn-dependent peptidase
MKAPAMAYETAYAQHQLPNGMRVVTASRPWSRTFAATLGFRVGWRNEPASQAGITHLLEHLAFCGANRQLAEQFGNQGLYVNGQTAYEQTHFILSGHAGLMPGAMQFFSNVLAGIKTDPGTIAEEIPILGHELAAAEESPMDLEMRKLTARIIGDKNFGRPVLATLKGLQSIKPEELLSFLRGDQLFHVRVRAQVVRAPGAGGIRDRAHRHSPRVPGRHLRALYVHGELLGPLSDLSRSAQGAFRQ